MDDSNNLLDGLIEGIPSGMEVDEDGSDDDATWVPEPANAGPEAFEKSRPAQKLSILPSLGMVEIELELEGRSAPLTFQVSPLQASIIHLFEDQATMSLSQIAAKVQMAESTLEPNMSFWILKGVLQEINHRIYQLIEENPATQT
ncbi:hypothetical protein BG004_008431 [Podila humilis]|nr:hypothetical protein BG004_008431 [Podila humilis]